ncbi:MAG: carbohydrate-binding protein [Lentisphaeria bacterium]|nr:carbohydrate-binding protein [Lentisphaeria bacterium]
MNAKTVYGVLLSLTAIFALSGADSRRSAAVYCDFSKAPKLQMFGPAKVSNGTLKLDGKKAFAKIPGSSGLHLTTKGMTLVATVKFHDPSLKAEKVTGHDMIFAKNKEFIFGRFGKEMYFNFYDGKTYCAGTRGGRIPCNTWGHYAAVIEHFKDSAQGDEGYKVSIFINGELEISRRFLQVKPHAASDLVELGRGFGGGTWLLDGEIANAAIYNRPFSEAEVAELCAAEKRVKGGRKGFFEVDGKLKSLVEKTKTGASPAVKWVADSILRTASVGADQQKLYSSALLLSSAKKDSDIAALTSLFNRSDKNMKMLLTGDLALLAMVGKGSGGHPAAGLYDRRSNRGIFGEKTLSWQLKWRNGRQHGDIDSNSRDGSWEAALKDANALQIRWKWNKPFAFTAETPITLKGSRMETTMRVVNNSPAITIADVTYPVYNFKRLPGKNDFMVFPWMSGMLVKNPTVDQLSYGQEGVYPSGRVMMQFGAYYDENSGIYFAYEDGRALTKAYSVVGKRGCLNASWNNPVPIAANAKGGNGFTMSGKGVIELYKGSWYEAGAIYRKFLERDSIWWIKELPRKSTPEWFRNNTMWIRDFIVDGKKGAEIRDAAAYLRSYLELPFAFHWYWWEDNAKLGWPHFPAKDYVAALNREIRANGIYTMPYIDSRLWKVKDGPNKTDYMYSSHGKKYAVKNRDGSVNLEVYSNDNVYAVMCPAVKAWQNVLKALTLRMANAGFDAVYHDQVCTAKPYLCFDKSHGHKNMNDPELWLKEGYWHLYDDIFAVLRKTHPGFSHTTEEFSEPYLNQFDGFLVWRWTDPGQIPLVQSIYSGRGQFFGRLFDNLRQGDKQSFASKVAQQLVNAEQIGGFNVLAVSDADDRRLFLKKAMHVRHILLPWFNGGRMLAPLKFRGGMPMERQLWGGTVAQFVTMPQIANTIWRGKDNSRMIIFVNTQKKTVKVKPEFSAKKGFWICREGASEPVFSRNTPELVMKARSFEVWLEGSKADAEKIQKTLKKTASFDYGKPWRAVVKFAAKKFTVVPGKLYGPGDASGLRGCAATADKSRIGWMEDGALIAFGEGDFGKNGVGEFALKVAVPSSRVGGSIEIFATAPGKPEVKLGELVLKNTGGWTSFKEETVKFKTSLRGRQNIIFKVNGNASCNFAGWRCK